MLMAQFIRWDRNIANQSTEELKVVKAGREKVGVRLGEKWLGLG